MTDAEAVIIVAAIGVVLLVFAAVTACKRPRHDPEEDSQERGRDDLMDIADATRESPVRLPAPEQACPACELPAAAGSVCTCTVGCGARACQGLCTRDFDSWARQLGDGARP